MASRAAPRTESGLAAQLAAIASVGAACIHFAVATTRWQEWTPSGLFFIALALCQLIWAPTVLARTTATVLAFGILLNAAAIVLWARSQNAGVPFAPDAVVPDAVRGADLCALLLEIYVVMGASWVWYRGLRRRRIPALVNAFALLCIGGVIASATTLGVASGLGQDQPSPAGADSESHYGTAEIVIAPG